MQLRTIVTTHAVRWIRIGPPREKGLYNGAFGESKFVIWTRSVFALRIVPAAAKKTT